MLGNASLRFNPHRLPASLTSRLVWFAAFWLIVIWQGPSLFAAQVSLTWDPNTESNLVGYRVHYGTASRVYGSSIDVGNVTTHTIPGLAQGQTYFFAVTAYDTSSNESGYSNEASGLPTEPTQSYVIDTSPPGLLVEVDGVPYTAPQTFKWVVGSLHTISVPSPQEAGSGARHAYSSWSDGGAQSHTVTASVSSATYAASFSTQYSLTTAVTPSGAGSVIPSGTNWYDIGQVVSISASATPGNLFTGWSGDLSGKTNPASLVMNGPKAVWTQFAPMLGFLSVIPLETWSGCGRQGGPFEPSSQTYILRNTGSSYINWGVSKSNNWLSVSPKNGKLGPGESVKVTASLNSSAQQLKTGSYSDTLVFSNRTSGSGDTSVSVILRIDPRIQAYVVQTSPPGLEIVADGINYTAPKTLEWEVGSIHTLSFPSPQSQSPEKRYVFKSFNNEKGQTQTVVAPDSKKTNTAAFTTQYSLTTSVSSSGGKVTPSGTNWYHSGEKVVVTANPVDGYQFSGWSGDMLSSSNPVKFEMKSPKYLAANFSYVGKANEVEGSVSDGKEADNRMEPESSSEKKNFPLIGSLESPVHEKKISGVKTIYGWALDGQGILKVELFIDGNYIGDIPYGGIREDVREDYPDYPSAGKSGFALVWNYSVLSQGDHLIQVKAHNKRGEALDLSANVWVNKFHGEVVTQAYPSELSIPGVRLTADGVTKTYELRLEWATESQAFEISEIIER